MGPAFARSYRFLVQQSWIQTYCCQLKGNSVLNRNNFPPGEFQQHYQIDNQLPILNYINNTS